MKYTLQLSILLISAWTVTSSYAESKSHSHGGRVHNHPLPAQGVKHRHGGGILGIINTSSSIQINKTALKSLPWLNHDLVESRNWKAKINIQCLEKNKICGTIDFRSLNCGGKLTFLRKSSNNYIFSDRIEYGRCTQNCQINIRNNGLSYKEFCKNKYTGGGDLLRTNIIKKSSSSESIKTNNQWMPLGKEEAYKLISGNVLISEHKIFCDKSDSSKICKKIAILEPSNNVKGQKNKATIIYPKKRKTTKSNWGFYATSWYYLDLDMGIIPIPVNHNSFKFEDVVFVNKNKKSLRIKSPGTNKIIYINIVRGKNSYYLAQAKKGNYDEINERGKMTIGQVIAGKVLKGIGDSLKPSSNNTSGQVTKPNQSSSYTPRNNSNISSRKPASIKPKVKRIYIGSHAGGTAQYVIECKSGSSYSSINQKSNGFWYSYSSNMGRKYKGLSIEEVANKKCN